MFNITKSISRSVLSAVGSFVLSFIFKYWISVPPEWERDLNKSLKQIKARKIEKG